MSRILYRKPLNAPLRPLKTVRLSDFSRGINKGKDENILPLNYAAMTYNFSARDGALKDGVGLAPFVFNGADMSPPANIRPLRAWHYRRYDPIGCKPDDRLVIYAEDGGLYARSLWYGGEFTAIEGADFSAPPDALNYRLNGDDVLIFCSGGENMTVWDGENYPYTVTDSPRITSMDVHFERLFATVDGERRQVWFSDDLDPTNWDLTPDDAGFIEMTDERGALLRAVSFLDYLYVFREYGISRISASGGQEEFAVSQLFVSSGRIRAETVTPCGDKILFLADDGLYAFNGLSAVRVLGDMSPLFNRIANDSASAAYCDNKYYLACRLDYGDGQIIGCEARPDYVNNTVIELDLSDMRCYLSRGIDVSHMAAVKCGGTGAAVIACARNADGEGMLAELDRSGAVDGVPLPKKWITPMTDFGTDKTKILKHISLQTDTDITLRIVSDGESKTVTAHGGAGIRRVPVNVKGKTLCVSFECAVSGARISSPILFFDVI
jgi:hypothetical protein